MKEVDKVREAYWDDPTVSNQDYGKMVEDADKADQVKEWDKEVSDADRC